MKQLLPRHSWAILVMALLFAYACEKDAGLLGLDAIGESRSRVGVLKQYPVRTFTVFDDSVLTTNPQRAIAGSYRDPRLGFHQASFATHLLLQSSQPDFGDNARLDSARMVLRYQGFYGDTNQAMSIRVLQLDEYLDPDADDGFYSSKVWKRGTLLGDSGPVLHRPNTLDVLDNGIPASRLVIPLDTAYLQQLIIDEAVNGNSAFDNNNNFIEYFNGIVVESGGEDGCMVYFETLTGLTRLELYYHNDTDTSVFYLETDNSGSTANSFVHDYSQASFDPANPDTANGELYTYVQAMGGVITALEFPTLHQLVDSAFLINKAELVFRSEIGSDANGYAPPTQLLILETGANDTGKVLIKDYRIGASTGVGGTLIKGTYKDKQYRFNISRHIFERLADYNGKGTRLFLVAGSGASTSNRVILNGNLHPVNPLTLDLYFSTNP